MTTEEQLEAILQSWRTADNSMGAQPEILALIIASNEQEGRAVAEKIGFAMYHYPEGNILDAEQHDYVRQVLSTVLTARYGKGNEKAE